MQGVGLPGLRTLSGAGARVRIDARPLRLTCAICAGAAAYFPSPLNAGLSRCWQGRASCSLPGWRRASGRSAWTHRSSLQTPGQPWMQAPKTRSPGVGRVLQSRAVRRCTPGTARCVRLAHRSAAADPGIPVRPVRTSVQSDGITPGRDQSYLRTRETSRP